jgi:hypothetical protein
LDSFLHPVRRLKKKKVQNDNKWLVFANKCKRFRESDGICPKRVFAGQTGKFHAADGFRQNLKCKTAVVVRTTAVYFIVSSEREFALTLNDKI